MDRGEGRARSTPRRHRCGAELVQTLVRASHECGPRIGFEVTAAKVRSVWDTPPIGWVTVLAGLLARGFSPCIRPSQFPSGRNGCGSPLTVAGAATAYVACVGRRSVFPLASSSLQPKEPARKKYSSRPGASIRRNTQTDVARAIARCRSAGRPLPRNPPITLSSPADDGPTFVRPAFALHLRVNSHRQKNLTYERERGKIE